jgi:hypothetical protein
MKASAQRWAGLSRRARVRLALTGVLLAAICGAGALMFWAPPWRATPVPVSAWFPAVDATALEKRPGVDFIPGLAAYQQTTEYTAGPAALLTIARYYGLPGIAEDAATELRIAAEAGTRDLSAAKPGTRPEEMAAWLEKHGFTAELTFEDRGDGSALAALRANLRRGVPTLVEWIDVGGAWAIAAGYDDRGNTDPWDDVLILADPYDRYDDHRDGYTIVNANRFYWMWFDALYFDKLTWRTMISVTRR